MFEIPEFWMNVEGKKSISEKMSKAEGINQIKINQRCFLFWMLSSGKEMLLSGETGAKVIERRTAVLSFLLTGKQGLI